MRFSFAADYHFDDITCVTADFLKSKGISLLLLDLDNTLVPYEKKGPHDRIMHWIGSMRDGGITLFLVSNNRTDRVRKNAAEMGLEYVMHAKKPRTEGVRKAMELAGKTPEETALAGDQSFTDVIAANRAGIMSILVMPMSLVNPVFAARYVAELPFRRTCLNDLRKKKKNGQH